MFTAAFAEAAAAGRFVPPIDKGHVLMQGIQIQARHEVEEDREFIHLNKLDLTLAKGKSETLKATLLPGGKSVSVEWYSTNPKIAKVSQSGKVTAVAPGTTVISLFSMDYYGAWDQTGDSAVCYVTVPGGSKDAKPLDSSDRTYSYGNKKLTAPTNKFSEALANVKKSIGGNAYFSRYYYRTGLLFGSKDFSIAHTFIYYRGSAEDSKNSNGYGFDAYEKSPIKTNRGIGIGAKKSALQQKYGLPTYTPNDYIEARKIYEVYRYRSKTAGKALYTEITFYVLKSKGTVSQISLSVSDTWY
jgi:hypothetical protein